MLFGLCGASGTGKTTLAKKVAEDLSITFIPTSITENARALGYEAVGELSLSERLDLQWGLLARHLDLIKNAPRPLILDRTPIDILAYMMAELHMHSHNHLSPKELDSVATYVNYCLNAAAKFYDFVFCLAPLETYESDPRRPAPNPGYQLHTQMIMHGGLSMIYGSLSYAMVNVQSLDERVDFVTETIARRIDDITTQRNSSAHVH